MATMTAVRGKASKRPYKPQVRIVDRQRGLYTVQSERYKYVLYLVDAMAGTCECQAGQVGRMCKHRKAVEVVVRAFPVRQAAAVAIPAFDPATRPDLVAAHGGAAGLLEAFGA